MQAATESFDLVLGFPQRQGSGRPQYLPRGALATAEVCRRFGPLERVPEAADGEANDGVNRWTAILEQFLAARAILDARGPRPASTRTRMARAGAIRVGARAYPL